MDANIQFICAPIFSPRPLAPLALLRPCWLVVGGGGNWACSHDRRLVGWLAGRLVCWFGLVWFGWAGAFAWPLSALALALALALRSAQPGCPCGATRAAWFSWSGRKTKRRSRPSRRHLPAC